MEVILQIMDLQGRIVKRIEQNIIPNGYRYGPISWDGNSEHGAELNTGVYIYSLLARLSNGKTAKNSGRLILIE
jgi:flagellar hook assembly protein FlgD